jgi:hypothetical protein
MSNTEEEARRRRRALQRLEERLADGAAHSDEEARVLHRIAELRATGVRAMPMLTWHRREDGGHDYRVGVMLPDLTTEELNVPYDIERDLT